MRASPGPEDPPPQQAIGLAAAAMRPGTPGRFGEWLGGVGIVGEPCARWRAFLEPLGASGWAELGSRLARVQHRVRDDGITYNIHDESGQNSRPWPLELLPVIVEPEEWAVIEHGARQRARLLQATLADLHGGQALLRDALLPASLVFAHPQYLREAHGIVPPGGSYLHVVAFDIARAPTGGFMLLAQRIQAPSGLGYLLQNRLIVGPQFADAFAAMHVQRLAGSFRALLDGLMRASPAGGRSRVALLTSGPYSETYFEQVFLARYLGITLVEGSDITVRRNRLYLKTLRGLEQVHVLLRRVDDEYLDPLELRPDSTLGVPGLLQALRAGELLVANMPGAGVLESPGLNAFWPGVARRLLQEELLIPAATSWWCGEASVWAAQRERLHEFVVLPTFPHHDFQPVMASGLDAHKLRALAERIDADPAAFTLQARVQPSETPVWVGGGLHPRAAVMRVFALGDGQGGWHVLPGAMTRVAGADDAGLDPWLSMQRGSSSADTWVIAPGPVDPTTLLPKPLTAEEIDDGWHRSVTSRTAENLFWLGRYTERAENAVRLARVALEWLPEASGDSLALLDALVRVQGMVGRGVPTPMQSARLWERSLVQGLSDLQGRTSVAFNLRSLRSCAHALRDRLSPEHWQLIHEVGEHFEQHMANAAAAGSSGAAVPDVIGLLARAATHLSAITGAQTDRMTRDDGWRLLSVGRQIERLDTLADVLARGVALRLHEAEDGFGLLLALFDSTITYRAQFQGRRELLPLLHLLVLDTDNPRSLAWVARTLRDRLRKLARQDADWAEAVTADAPRPEAWPLASLGAADSSGELTALHRMLAHCRRGASDLSDAIGRRLFVHVDSVDRTVWQ